ncbi:ABC transporter substrate-binding protein [Spiractinospora alimapuensis]|uniref:ABC transporter substrate-binding protein n=1 Tax=Spiractinospora alimapuensis TaxID=2820884 RepID=UPI001F47B3BE|nr:ABC transporter substrate-binding protein [Spiractinospora alimapuensis]QVQ53072.1 ABC transporter substrate-binding protein [Spiractinospora alimapuensis]
MSRRKALGYSAAVAALALGLAACDSGGNGDGGNGDADVDPLVIGQIAPESGSLAFLGPPQIAAAELAVQDINDAGGIHGTEIPDIVNGDEGDDATLAQEAADRMVTEGVSAVIGPAASGMAAATYDTITGAGIVQCSGSTTAPDLSDIDDDGYFFRTAPSDDHAGPAMGQVIVGDGHSTVAIGYRADDYGEGYADSLEAELESVGAEVTAKVGYDPDTTNFDPIVSDMTDGDPDAFALVAFEEGTGVLAGLFEAGAEGDQMYVTDGMQVDDLGERIDESDPGIVDGVSGVAPGADAPEFSEALQEHTDGLDSEQFAAQVYDCVTIIGLAAEAAESTDPTEYVNEMAGVTQDGTECSDFAECRDLLADGEDIDYQGKSGGIAFDDNGDPTQSTYQNFGYDDGGDQTVFGYEDIGGE